MKQIIGGVIGVVVWVCVWVGIATFANWGFDPETWTPAGRGGWMITAILFSGFAAATGVGIAQIIDER